VWPGTHNNTNENADEDFAAMPEPPTVVRKALLEVAFQAETAIERVEVARVELAPAQPAGLHLHPCPVVGWVSAGVIRFQVADCPVMTLQAGDAFYEPANVRIPHFDNASETEAAVFIACYLLPPGEDRLIEMLV
jgi:quercetin dioxygenase-like cupin family protein